MQDPATGTDLAIQLPASSTATVTYLLSEEDVAALELTFQTSVECDSFRQIGYVGVDSAGIVIGDQIGIENCPDTALLLNMGKEEKVVADKIIKQFGLVTHRILDDTVEIVTDDCEGLYLKISEYVESKLRLRPNDYLTYHAEDGFWERSCVAAWDGGFFNIGDIRVFHFNTGGDGRFDVIGGYGGDALVKIWLQVQQGLFRDGKVEYTAQPLETRPPRKRPSPQFIEMLRAALPVRKKEPWWKFWQ